MRFIPVKENKNDFFDHKADIYEKNGDPPELLMDEIPKKTGTITPTGGYFKVFADTGDNIQH